MSETNKMLSPNRSDERSRLILLLENKIAVDYPKDLSPKENKKRILRDIYRKKVDRYGFKTKYFNSIVFNSNIYSLIYPFAGEFALTFSNGQFLPFNEGKKFDIHKVYRLDITNSDELTTYDFELSDIHADRLEDYITDEENPQNSVYYIVKILNKIKYENKNWTVLNFLYFFLINSQTCKKPCYIIFAITRYTIWTLFLIIFNIIYSYVLPNPDKIPYMFRQFIPSQFHERLFNMSKEDRKAINEIIANHNDYKDVGEALIALKAKRPNLYNLSMEIKDYINSKINELTPEAQNYVIKRVNIFREVRPTIEHKHEYLEVLQAIHDTIEEYNQLSEESKLNIAMTFPKIIAYITSDKFKKLIDGLMEDFEETS